MPLNFPYHELFSNSLVGPFLARPLSPPHLTQLCPGLIPSSALRIPSGGAQGTMQDARIDSGMCSTRQVPYPCGVSLASPFDLTEITFVMSKINKKGYFLKIKKKQ